MLMLTNGIFRLGIPTSVFIIYTTIIIAANAVLKISTIVHF